MKYLKLLIAVTNLAAIAALLKDNAYLRDRLDELTDKYWEGNRQIALYSDEARHKDELISELIDRSGAL